MSSFLNTSLFLSTHVNRIDGKGRVSFPAPFRSALTDRNSKGVDMFRSPSDSAIEGINIERLEQLSAALETLSPFSRDRAFFETAIFGTAQELQVDREGRCSLPRPLLEQVGIVGDVAFLGRGPTFQIWEPQALARRTAESTDALNSGAVAFPILPSGIL